MTRVCAGGCGKLLVLVMGTALPSCCWDCGSGKLAEPKAKKAVAKRPQGVNTTKGQ